MTTQPLMRVGLPADLDHYLDNHPDQTKKRNNCPAKSQRPGRRKAYEPKGDCRCQVIEAFRCTLPIEYQNGADDKQNSADGNRDGIGIRGSTPRQKGGW